MIQFFQQCILQDPCICLGQREGWCKIRACDILCIQRSFCDFSVAVCLNCDQGSSTAQISLINRKTDPPFITLVDLYHNQLSFNIYAFVISGSSLSKINKFVILKAVCLEICLISAHLEGVLLSVLICKFQNCFLEFPTVQCKCIFGYIGKSDSFHFLI